MTPQPRKALSSLPTEQIVALAKGQAFINAQARAQGVQTDERTVVNTGTLMRILRERVA